MAKVIDFDYSPNEPEVDEYVLSHWGREREEYLREDNRDYYEYLSITNSLKKHLMEVDKRAIDLELELTEQIAEREGVGKNSPLKQQDMLKYAALRRGIQLTSARPMVREQLIYV